MYKEKKTKFEDIQERENSHEFLAFYLNGKNYAFQILKVNEVIVLPEITPVPKSPQYMKGVINLRGQIIPIIDLRTALNIEKAEYDQQTCVIIVKMNVNNVEKLVGFIVDCVSEVFEITDDNIENPPDYGKKADDGYLRGIGKVKDKIVMILEIDKILLDQQVEEIFA